MREGAARQFEARDAGFCRHGNARTSCDSCKIEGELRARDVEQEIIFGELAAKAINAKVDVLRKDAAERGEKGGPVEFFEANLAHEEANYGQAAFREWIGRNAQKRFGKPVDQLTAEEMRGAFEAFPGKATLVAQEESAKEHYAAAASAHWELRRVGSFDAQLHGHDLAWREASRMPAGPDRERALDALDAEMSGIIKDGMALNDAGTGKRAEYQFMQMMRRWARAKGMDHLIAIEHTLPRDDWKNGIDMTLWIGDRRYQLDQKTLSPDSYQEEWQEKKLSAASEKAARVSGSVLHFASDRLRNAYADDVAGKAGRAKEYIANTVLEALPEERDVLVQLFAKKEKPVSDKLTKKELGRLCAAFFDVKRLVGMGVLDATRANDVSAVLAAKNAVVEQATKLITRKEDFEDQDVLEKIKRAATGGS